MLASTPFPAPFSSLGNPEWPLSTATTTVNVTAGGQVDYTLSLDEGTVLSATATIQGNNPAFMILMGPDGQLMRAAAGTAEDGVTIDPIKVTDAGVWTITLLSPTSSTRFGVSVLLGGRLEGADSSAARRLSLDPVLVTAGGNHRTALGTSTLVAGVDVDEYTINLSSRVGQEVDIVLDGLGGANYDGQRLELIGPGGGVLRTATARPSGSLTSAYSLGIIDFQVPMAGSYLLRLTSRVSGKYLLTVADNLHQSDPTASERLQWLVDSNLTTLGSVSALLNTLNFEQVFQSLPTDELLDILLRHSFVQGYGNVEALKSTLPSFGIDLTSLRPNGVMTALELAWNGSLLKNSLGQRITASAARDMLEADFQANRARFLNPLTTNTLFSLFDDRITTSASDPLDPLRAYTRRSIADQLDMVLSTARLQIQNEDKTFNPVPNGATYVDQVNAMPVGQRAIYIRDLFLVSGLFEYHIDRVDASGKTADYYTLWMDQWAKVVRDRFTKFFSQFKSAGGKLDTVIIDFERSALSQFELKADRRVNPNRVPSKTFWQTVLADPRWNELRDRLLRVGFTPDQLTLQALTKGWDSKDIREARWNAVMEERYSEYFYQAMVQPLKALFPEVRIANYGEGFRSHEQPYGSYARLRESSFTIGALSGTHQTPVLYASPGTVITADAVLSPPTAPRTEIDRISYQPVLVNGRASDQGTVKVTLRSPIQGLKVGDAFQIENIRGTWVDPQYEGTHVITWLSSDRTRLQFSLTIEDPAKLPRSANLTSRTNTTATAFFQVYRSYNGLVGDVMELRSNAQASNVGMLPWISSPQFRSIATQLDYVHYGEGIFHAALSGADDFLLWKWSKLGLDPDTDQYVNDLLIELNGLIGYEDRRTLSFDSVSWEDGYLLTGMEAGGRRIWRLTPDPTLPFKQLPGGGASFQIGNKTVTIPHGQVYTPASTNSHQGVWIIQTNTDHYLRGDVGSLATAADAFFRSDNPHAPLPSAVSVDGPGRGVTFQPLTFDLSTDIPGIAGPANLVYSIDWNADGRIDQTIQGGAITSVTHAFNSLGTHRFDVYAGTTDHPLAVVDSHSVSIVRSLVVVDSANPAMRNLYYSGTSGDDTLLFGQIDDGRVVAVEVSPERPFALTTFSDINGTVYVYGGGGNDRIIMDSTFLQSIPAVIDGGDGNDELTGGDEADWIFGGAGDDTITGGRGDDLLVGGDGNDVLRGEVGHDLIFGGAGNDQIFGDEGRDVIDGGLGADTISGGVGDDLIILGRTLADQKKLYDTLLPVRNEWASGLSYAQRVTRITTASNATGVPLLVARTTVKGDGAADRASGNGGQDWFWAAELDDTILDLISSESNTKVD